MKVTLTVTKQPDGGGGGGGGGGTGGDTTPPSASITVAKQKLKAVLKKGLAMRATSNEHCTLSIQLIVDKATAKKLKLGKKATVIGRLTSSFNGSAQFKVKLTAKAKKALEEGALGEGQRAGGRDRRRRQRGRAAAQAGDAEALISASPR